MKNAMMKMFGVVVAVLLVGNVQAANLTWNLTVNGAWNTSTANWTGDSTLFTDGGVDNVLFNNNAGGTITISANMTPLSTTVSAASGTYTFSGGPIDGGTLTKSGAGTLTLSNNNGFSGVTWGGGNLNIGSGALGALGTGTLTINSGAGTIKSDNSYNALTIGSLVLNGNFTSANNGGSGVNFGTGAVTLGSAIQVAANHGVVFGGTVSGAGGLTAFDITIAATGSGNSPFLQFTAPITMGSSKTITSDYSGGQYIYNGAIGDGLNGYGMTIGATGKNTTVNLGGNNTFTGAIQVISGSTLNLYGSTASAWGTVTPSSVTVNSGANLNFFDGNANSGGQISPSAELINNGTVRIGSSPNVNNNRVLSQGTHFSNVLSGSGTYNFGGTSGGHSYTIVLNGSNTYTGLTRIGRIDAANSALQFTSIKNVGGGSSALGAPTTAAEGTITFDYNSAIEYTGSGDTTDRIFDFASGITGGTIKASGTTTVSSPFEITSNFNPTSTAAKTLTLGGTGYGKWSGTIMSNVGATSLAKRDAGTWALAGSQTVGNLYVGYATSASGTLTVGSGGSLSVGSGSAYNLYVGVRESSGILDVSSSTSFTANVGRVWIGESDSVNNNNGVGTLKLGISNTITAATYMEIGGNYNMGGNQLGCLGTVTTVANGTTTIHTPTMYLGWGKTNQGTFTLNDGGTLDNAATLTLDGVGVAGGNRAQLILGYQQNNGSGRQAIGTMDLSRGVAHLSLSSIILGQNASSAGAYGIGSLTLSTSSSNQLDVSGSSNPVIIGQSNGGGSATGTLTFGGGTGTITATDNGTAILLGSSTGAYTQGTGTLNLNGGALTITTTGAAVKGGVGTSRLYLDGGAKLIAGAASTDWINSLTTAEIKSGGATIDTNGNDIGFSQGFTGEGGLIKAGSGKLTISTAQSYLGTTSIEAGVLELTDTGILAGGVTVEAGGTLGGTGRISAGGLHFAAGGKLLFNSATFETSAEAIAVDEVLLGDYEITFDGFSVASLVGLNETFAEGTYTLITGRVDVTNLSNVGVANAAPIGDGSKSAYFQEGSLQLVIIPEPATLGLMGVMGIAMLLRRRIVRG